MMKYKTLLLAFLFFSTNLSAQLQYFSPDAMNGYTLFSGDELFLVNNCGEVVNTWNPVSAKYHVKLLPNGNIIYVNWFNNSITERDWEDNLVNEVAPQDAGLNLDYEVILLENGNYLCVGRKYFTQQEFIDIGYNLDLGSPYQVDVVVELDRNTGESVWLWNITDHVIQERSDTIPNYGSIIDHPELLNLDAISTLDWMNEESWMINGMDYNPTLDQIVLSVRKMGEIIIIDHSTTTEEAAGHTGGNAGKGGDILYRWGNPQNYNRGTAADRFLYFQHNPNWIQYGEHVGKIAIYNNGLYRPDIPFGDSYSEAPIIETPLLPNGNYTIAANAPFEPSVPTVNYGMLGGMNEFYSAFTSANKVLQNGNVLITVGGKNKVIELKPDGTLVWEYQLATAGFTFRAEKYPTDYSAFDGRDLTPGATIEIPSSSVPCELVSSSRTVSDQLQKAWIDANHRQLYVQAATGVDYDFLLSDLLGRTLQSFNNKDRSGNYHFQLNPNIKGMLILMVRDKATGQSTSAKLWML